MVLSAAIAFAVFIPQAMIGVSYAAKTTTASKITKEGDRMTIG